MKITICGGGNLGHVTAGFLSAQSDNEVRLLTTQPQRWSNDLVVTDPQGKVYLGQLAKISADASEVVADAEMILLCLPGYAIAPTLSAIKPYLPSSAWVGSIVSSTGFFFEAIRQLPAEQPLFGFQRVPFISRITAYGHEAQLKGYKESLSVAFAHTKEDKILEQAFAQKLEKLFHTPVKVLNNYYEASLSNSNPLLHPARLYTMWNGWQPGMTYSHNPEFYGAWTDEASQLLIDMDGEFQQLLKRLNVRSEAVPSILLYYESTDAQSLTRKIRSIEAFKGILSPMSQNSEGLFVPDFTSRYFTEDFPYGMRFIVELARQYSLPIPIIQKVYTWGMQQNKNEAITSVS